MSRCRVGLLKSVAKYGLLLALCLGLAGPQLTPKQEVELAQIKLPVDLSDTEVIWDTCGGWNGYYFHLFNLIVLCEENLEEGVEVGRFIFLHELGHRFTFSRNFTFVRWRQNYEAAADEFAAVVSILQGHPMDLLKMAALYRDWGKKHPWSPKDPHPPMEKRAEMMEEIFMGYVFSRSSWRNTLQFWGRQWI